ncbi:MAG: HRDC domain-containing protein [Candidatus Cohnella colombiensis]|uniref:HRDC domain-containing protein n=1 Tax=Candidatus Cohnella colombiensis TaxID=3121368 RepID=A0AA95EYF7_9BACL|nr:MAG: HRDC domain-containing protein [Cohnella sp.]
MQVVFLNQFDRIVGQGEDRAQVFIGEEQGVWSAGWRSIQPTAAEQEDLWYEGMSWEELLAAFRHGVACKLSQGFRPMLDGMLEEAPLWERRPSALTLLQCYADMQDATETGNKLRIWRRARATEEKKSAYLIATNRELQMLAVYLPQSLEELIQIPGYGQVKLERYGKELVELLKDIPRKHTFPLLTWVSKEVTEEQRSSWIFKQKEEKYSKVLASVREKRTLLLGIREGRTLTDLENLLQCTRRQLLERIEQLDEEGYDVQRVVEQELATLPDEECEQIETAMKELGDQYLKPLMHKVYGDIQANAKDTEGKYEKLRMMRLRYRKLSRSAI